MDTAQLAYEEQRWQPASAGDVVTPIVLEALPEPERSQRTSTRMRTAAMWICTAVGLAAALIALPATWAWRTAGTAASAARTTEAVIALPEVRQAIATELVQRSERVVDPQVASALAAAKDQLVAVGVEGLAGPGTRQVVRDGIAAAYPKVMAGASGPVVVDLRPAFTPMLDAMRVLNPAVPALPDGFGIVTLGGAGTRQPDLSQVRSGVIAAAVGGTLLALVCFAWAWALSRRRAHQRLCTLGWCLAWVGLTWVASGLVARSVVSSALATDRPWVHQAISSTAAFLSSSLILWAMVVALIGAGFVASGALVGAVRARNPR